ncbi:hypothetical protein [Rhodanobacter lindaniclasticus]
MREADAPKAAPRQGCMAAFAYDVRVPCLCAGERRVDLVRSCGNAAAPALALGDLAARHCLRGVLCWPGDDPGAAAHRAAAQWGTVPANIFDAREPLLPQLSEALLRRSRRGSPGRGCISLGMLLSG